MLNYAQLNKDIFLIFLFIVSQSLSCKYRLLTIKHETKYYIQTCTSILVSFKVIFISIITWDLYHIPQSQDKYKEMNELTTR